VAVIGVPWACARTKEVPAEPSPRPAVIVVSFLGGFVRADDIRHPEVALVRHYATIPGVHAAAFENRQLKEAYQAVVNWLDTDKNGRLSPREKQNAKIILFGHSWGGDAVLRFARELDRNGIPVALTIQVDSIARIYGNECLVPANVREALNYYQTGGLLHGCTALEAQDPSRTKILGNFRFQYPRQPPECRKLPWFDQHIFKDHNAMECDPRVWSQVQEQIDARIGSRGRR
jgi:hypothetical protein